MKQEDLFEAIGAIEEERLAATEKTVRKPRLIRIAAIAAIIMLLTACGVTVGHTFQIIREKDVLVDGDQEVEVEKLSVTADLAPVTISEEGMEYLKRYCNSHWIRHGKNKFFKGEEDNKLQACVEGIHYFTTLEQVEEKLGLQFSLPAEVREGAAEQLYKQKFPFVSLYSVSPAEARKEYTETGAVSPSGLVLVFVASDYSEFELMGNYVSCAITIPFTEAFVEQERLNLLTSVTNPDDDFTVESVTVNGREGALIHVKESAYGDQIVSLTYSDEQGIGYEIAAYDENADNDAMELLEQFVQWTNP